MEDKIDDIEIMLEKYKPLVITIARRYYVMGAELDDIVQEGMIGLYKGIISYDKTKNDNFVSFISICIKRQIISAIRKNKSLKNSYFKELINDEYFYINDIPSTEENPENKIIIQEDFGLLKKEIMSKLTVYEKKILIEFVSGKSYDEIAKNLNKNKKSVDNALTRIRNKLSYLLK